MVVCGALPGAAAQVPAWVPGELAAAGVPASPGPVREGTGLGLVTSVTGPALIGEALAGAPAGRARKITPRLMMELSLARALGPGTASAVLRQLAQRPREAGPGYDLPAASSLPTPMRSCKSSRSCGCCPCCPARSGRCRCPA